MIDSMWQRTRAKTIEKTIQFFVKTDFLPDEVKDVDPTLSLMADTPMIELKGVRRLADELSFVVLPFAYL